MSLRSWITAIVFALLGVVAAAAQSPPPTEPVRVQLDNTGIASWRFVNPVNPPHVDGQPLIFSNTTGDRTFVVTMPFVYSASELTRAYAIAHDERGRQTVAEIVAAALRDDLSDPTISTTLLIAEDEKEISLLEGLRMLLEAVSAAKKSPSDWCGLDTAGCVVETLFWTAACNISNDELKLFVEAARPPHQLTQNLQQDATALVDHLFGLPTSSHAWPRCDLESVRVRRSAFIANLSVSYDGTLPIEKIAAAAEMAGRKERFDEERTKLAREALGNELKARLGKQIGTDKTTGGLENVFKKLEQHRALFEAAQNNSARQADIARYQCRLREIEAAGKLLRSYGTDFDVPFAGVPASLSDANAACNAQQYGSKSSQALTEEIRQSLIARASEQGIEVTDCDRDASPMTCMATATIPPYQSAAFSSGVLAHHPSPRIRFNVAFFGEPDPPSNATGYVLRSDAKPSDKKPKGQSSFGFGSDASMLLDPTTELRGQLRHTAASGTLTFQHSGPFEVSATLQYKRGDFGGVLQPVEKKVEATQYQAKVFGLGGMTLQYGNTVFAKPSSGIAVSVAGEGFQAGWGYGTLSYVLKRESDFGQADSDDDDHHVILGQLKSLPLNLPLFRTLDLIALFGEEKLDELPPSTPQSSLPLPYEYWTVGGETRFGFRGFPSVSGSIAGYHSRRNVGLPDDPAATPATIDGRGSVGLLRVSWTNLIKPPLTEKKQRMRPTFAVTGLLGYGSGDGSEDERDDDYLGESAGYSNDQIFLSRVSQTFRSVIKPGLANKTYAGLQYTDSRFSPLVWISQLLKSKDDIETQATILSAHSYWFHEPVNNHGRFAGAELDMEFQLESPKNVRWSLVAAYFSRSDAVEQLGVETDPWLVAAKVAITLR